MKTYPERISYQLAREISQVVAAAKPLGHERVSVQRAGGRILAESVAAPLPLPVFDHSTMDGFALRHADLAADTEARLRVSAEQFAGMATDAQLGRGECIRITTGAAIPAGADTVVPKELVLAGEGWIKVSTGVEKGAHIRLEGSDVSAGQVVLEAGTQLTPARIGLAAALGVAELTVSRRPTVAVFTTGDELVEPGLRLEAGKIYNGNRELVMGLLRAEGLEPVAWPNLPDDPSRIQAALADAADAFDLVVTCGGTSAGERDHLPDLLQAHGEIHFRGVNMRPGKPTLLASLGRSLVLCLPGNPASALAGFLTLGRLLVDVLQGRRPARERMYARIATPWEKANATLQFVSAKLQHGQDGTLLALPLPPATHHSLRAAADGAALIMLPEGTHSYLAGDAVQIFPY